MVLEMQQKLQQQWCFYMFLTKNGVAGVDSLGGHPPHPPGGELLFSVNFLMYWRKAIQLLEMQQKVILNETLQNWRVFLYVLDENG